MLYWAFIFFVFALVAGLQGVTGIELPNWLGRTAPAGLSVPYQAFALLASSFAFGALFQVPRRWLWTSLASCTTGWVVAQVAVYYRLPGHIVAFCAALAVCVLSNALARTTKRPA